MTNFSKKFQCIDFNYTLSFLILQASVVLPAFQMNDDTDWKDIPFPGWNTMFKQMENFCFILLVQEF